MPDKATSREFFDELSAFNRKLRSGFDALVRKRVDAALHASEERFRTLADHAPVMIWVTDTEQRCTWVNRRWVEFTGQTFDTGVCLMAFFTDPDGNDLMLHGRYKPYE